GRRDLISSLSKAAIAAGADGLLIEMHPNPDEAVSDGPQSLTPEQFVQLAGELGVVAKSVGRVFSCCGHEDQDTLESLRNQLDSIDGSIIEHLAARMQIVRKVGDQKRLDGIKDIYREKEIIKRLVNLAAELQLPPEIVTKIYPLIFEFGAQTQIKNKLAQEKELELTFYPMGSK
ncbi:MAG TPA: chorismate mutase, partial [Desulfosporosinus sp.]|nr:chorismate mutase [Desulfosporosinus sp.]